MSKTKTKVVHGYTPVEHDVAAETPLARELDTLVVLAKEVNHCISQSYSYDYLVSKIVAINNKIFELSAETKNLRKESFEEVA